ncbi:uncharacterized protein LOC105693991 isoform X2 [Athalia rosae]|uniref:uncharacterized protein LOC105693991 isoform X2 n=1 Tax=Athalia rosae TaxID=37344 RepID=UPI00203485B6|nr:uncharacterized protein LOC105693991 isoform X2 [Athalia rosae]
MPGKVKVKILAGRNLPVMDRSSDTTDAYVEIKFSNTTYKTDVCRKSLNPQWNSEWYRFEVDEAELQDEPLQIRLMDHDTYSANDAIGKVYLDLNPLLLPGTPLPVKNMWTLEASMSSSSGTQGGSVMTGWIPVYDTMHGIRGEVNIIVKVELFSDFNKFRQSSCGVQFFCSPIIPHGYHAQVIHGFVEELVVNDDPEYKWIDKIRTPRASNEARQTLFFKLSGEVQRKIGLKALDLGGNAVIGYHQCFDLEGESGIVARGIGTAVSLVKMHDVSSVPVENMTAEELALLGLPRKLSFECLDVDESVPLLSRSPEPSSIPFFSGFQSTRVSTKFPGYGKNLKKRPKPMVVVPNYRSAGSSIKMLRQMSQQPSYGNFRRSFDSSLSLSEDHADEMSLRSILAQEDMRGEATGNRFSRGLKNLRYLPQNMLSKRVNQIRARFSDTYDDQESDLDSSFSSAWSLSSESVRSSISDLYSLGRNKKNTHKRNSSDGIAALLIRSVHAGLALDSVMEDHETPAPSPSRIIDSSEVEDADSKTDEQKSCRRKGMKEDGDAGQLSASKKFAQDLAKGIRISISTSESETESSEEEPSESSTNYNILDDSLTTGEPRTSSTVAVDHPDSKGTKDANQGNFFNYEGTLSGEKKNVSASSEPSSSSGESRGSDIWFDKRNSNEEAELLPQNDPTFVKNFGILDIPQVELANDSNSSRDSIGSIAREIIGGMELTEISNGDTIAITSSMTAKQTEFLERQEHFDDLEDSKPAAASTPTEEKGCDNFFPDVNPWAEVKTANLQRSVSLNERATGKFTTPCTIGLKKKSESFKTEPKRKLSIFRTLNLSPSPGRRNLGSRESQGEGKFLDDSPPKLNEISTLGETTRKNAPAKEANRNILPRNQDKIKNFVSRGEKSSEKREKSSRKVERNETVIYRGAQKDLQRTSVVSGEKEVTERVLSTPQTLPKPKPISIVVAAPSVEDDHRHLAVPLLKVTDANTRSNFTNEESESSSERMQRLSSVSESNLEAERSRHHKHKQQCMLELIKIIDTKMLVHSAVSHNGKDSSKSKKRRKDKVAASLSPSPDSLRKLRTRRKKSRSKSPEVSSLQSYGTGSSITRLNCSSVSSGSRHALPIASDPNSNEAAVTVDREKHPDAFSDMNENSPTVRNSGSLDVVGNNCNTSEESNPPRDVGFPSICLHVEEYDPEGSSEVDDNREIAAESLASKPLRECLPVDHNDYDNNSVSNVELRDFDYRLESSRSDKRCITNVSNQLLTPNKLTIVSVVRKSHSECNLREVQDDVNITNSTNTANKTDNSCVPCYPDPPRHQTEGGALPATPSPAPPTTPQPPGLATKMSKSPVSKANTAVPIHRRSSDSDLSITPKGGTVSARSVKLLERISNLEEPESRDAWWTEIRMEVRSHARALACNVVLGYREETSICDDVCVLSAAGTAAVINLQNTSQELENPMISRMHPREITTTSLDRTDFEREKAQQSKTASAAATKNEKSDKNEKAEKADRAERLDRSEKNDKNDKNEEAVARDVNGETNKGKQSETEHSTPHLLSIPTSTCSVCHLPYSENSVPFRVKVLKCAICRRGKVPDILFTTIELPESIPIIGRGCFVQATVCRPKRDLRGELNAKEISDGLPFLEYELHSLLLNKIKVKSMNALFGLRVQVSIGERLLIGMATGTAVYLAPLPTPAVPKVTAGNSWNDEQKLADIQKSLIDTVKKNREFYQLKSLTDSENGRTATSDTDDSEEEMPEIDLGVGNKDACVLEVDDMEEVDKISMLMESRPPEGFHVVNTQTIPGLEDLEIVRNLQMFTQLWRAKIPVGQPASVSTKYFGRLLQSVYFKLRKMVPCALCDLQFKVELPEPDEIQLSVVGMALGLGEPTKMNKYKRKILAHSISRDQVQKSDDNDLIFSLDEDNVVPENSAINSVSNFVMPNVSALHSTTPTGSFVQRTRPRSPLRARVHTLHKHRHVPLKERYGVDITPLSYMPGGKIERYLGNLNFFFIRESTAIREGGGLSGFVHSFVTEVLAIVRAHVTALGGNAMVAYFMTECVLAHSPHKNQGQCLINVGGDVVFVSYFAEDKHQGTSVV